MHGLVRLLIFGFAAVLLLIGIAISYDAYEKWKIERYYQTHPLQKRMLDSAIQSDGSIRMTNAGPKQVLLGYTPIGTPENDIFTKLSREDFNCERTPASRKPPLVICYITNETRTDTRFRWHIELTIDESEKLADARVLMLK